MDLVTDRPAHPGTRMRAARCSNGCPAPGRAARVGGSRPPPRARGPGDRAAAGWRGPPPTRAPCSLIEGIRWRGSNPRLFGPALFANGRSHSL